RVGIARALINKPEIILMDEPFGALDEITKSNLQNEIKKIHNETLATIIFVTHSVEEAFKLGTKVLIINDGEIQQYDIPEKVRKNPKNDYVKLLVCDLVK
ncbi:MAG: ABC transporter ATP-binding protein, partial [Lachnospirales bacterium]